jgi:hypothetical protein
VAVAQHAPGKSKHAVLKQTDQLRYAIGIASQARLEERGLGRLRFGLTHVDDSLWLCRSPAVFTCGPLPEFRNFRESINRSQIATLALQTESTCRRRNSRCIQNFAGHGRFLAQCTVKRPKRQKWRRRKMWFAAKQTGYEAVGAMCGWARMLAAAVPS